MIVFAGSLPHPNVTSAQSAPDGKAYAAIVHPGPDGKLVYQKNEAGDILPDFSNCGYKGGGVPLPKVEEKVALAPGATRSDDTARVQAAIDRVSALKPDSQGIRGAVLLKRGHYFIEGTLHLASGGVVLRGEGDGEDGTVLVATGTSKRDLIEAGSPKRTGPPRGPERRIAQDYVPVGARSFRLAPGAPIKPGDTIFVIRRGNADWIHEIGMDHITPRPNAPGQTLQWQPFDLEFDRVVTAVDGDLITVDAPIACSIDRRWGGGSVAPFSETRISEIGVENLRGDSEFNPSIKETKGEEALEGGTIPAGGHYSDENHCRSLLLFHNVLNAWADHLTAVHFVFSCVSANGGAKWVTVQNSRCIDMVSRIDGGRRYPFDIEGGQLCLFQYCTADTARHSFAIGSHVPGPNAFVRCAAARQFATSEPHHRWSVGTLFDNVHSNIAIQDRQYYGTGHGWAGANTVAWNCEGSLVCQKPPTAQNYAIGQVGTRAKGAFPVGKEPGDWESFGRHVMPESLYEAQLKERLASVRNN